MSESWNDDSQIDYLIQDLVNLNGREGVGQFFSNEINTLKHHAQLYGLTDENLTIMIDFLIPSKLNERQYRLVLNCLIPVNTISGELVEKFLIWLISFQNYKIYQNKARWIFQWVNGLLEFNLLDPKTVDDYYFMLMPMLECTKLGPQVANIIYRFTKCTDVNLILIDKLRGFIKKNSMPCYKEVLRKYKEFRPDLIPESIPHQNLRTCFSTIPTELKESFQRVQERMGCAENIQQATGSKNKDFKIIPKYISIDVTPFIYQKKTKFINQFNDLNELMHNLHDIKEPSQSLSCLNDEPGFFYLLSSDEQFQHQFSYTLYNMLYKVFILGQENVSLNEQKLILNQIANYQMLLPVGHTSVSLFLKEFLQLWDFDNFKSEILTLVQYLVFHDFKDLYDSYLYHIYRLFLVSELAVKNEIIISLGNFIERIITFDIMKNKFEGKFDSLYKLTKSDWVFESTFANLMKYVDKICEQALNIENDDFLLLHNSLQLYEKVNLLEIKFDLSTITITPPGVTYRSMFSSDQLFVSRICALFESYISIFEKFQHLNEDDLPPSLNKNITLINTYINDFMAFIIKGKPLENETGYFNGSQLEEICREHVFPFDLTQHLAFLPTILNILKKLPEQEIIKREDIINELDPSIQSLIKKLTNY